MAKISPEPLDVKKWYASKTIWVGILEVVGGLLLAISQQLSEGAPITIVGILTILLRLITSSKIVK